MDTPEPTELLEDLPTPVPAAPASKRSAFVGAILGMTALAGTIVGVSSIAGAQDDPAPESTIEPVAESDSDEGTDSDDEHEGTSAQFDVDIDFEAFEACMTDRLGDLWTEPEIFFDEDLPFDEESVEIAEFESFSPADEQRFTDAEAACEELLPEDVKAEIEAWRPYEECIDGQIGDLDDPWAEGDEPSEADWEAHDAAWEAADDACRDLLPAEAQAEMAAWDAFDDCLRDAGVFDEGFEGSSAVHIETGDGFQIAEFGDTSGSVTITGTDGDLTVTATGGVALLDEATLDAQWEAFDAAHVACEDALPDDLEDSFGFGEFEVEMFEDFDEEYEEDED